MSTPEQPSLPPPVAMPPATAAARASYEELYTTHYEAVVGVLARMLGSHEEAEDAAQTTFLKVWTNWSRLAGLTPVSQKHYVYVMGHNTATDALRHRWGHPRGEPLSLDRPSRTHAPSVAGDEGTFTLHHFLLDHDPSADPERVAIGRDLLDRALADIGVSSDRAQEILLFAHGYTAREVVDIMRAQAQREAQQQARAATQTSSPRHAAPCITSNNLRMRRMRTRARIKQHQQPDENG